MLTNRYYRLLLIGFITFIFLLRICLFAGSYGGVEHDSGWFLGVAKNLAHRGIYASYTNTVINEGAGSFPSIFKRYSIQDKNGFIYFPAAVTVGPGYIIPEAAILKMFGDGWWQYRAWPLISFTLMLFLTLYIVLRIGGPLALFVFSFWLWLVPQFTTQFAYEAFSEDIAFLYLLAGFYLLYLMHAERKNILLSFLAGISIALSFLTKTLFLLPILGFIVFFVWDFFNTQLSKKNLAIKWIFFVLGAILPIASFYAYEYTYVISHFGIAGWHAIAEDNRLILLQAGSGIASISSFFSQNPYVLNGKFQIWMDVGSNLSLFLWLAFLFSPVIFLRYLKKEEKIFCIALYAACFISFFWFLFIATDGWGRYIWQGLFIGMMLICIMIGLIKKNIHFKSTQILWFVIVPLLIFLAYTNYPVLSLAPILPDSTVVSWAMIHNDRGPGLNGFPSNDIFSVQDQEQVVTYFAKNIKPNDRVYYLAGFLNAEMATLTDTVFYPIQRYINLKQTNPFGGNSYLIIGPYQQGFWSLEPKIYVQKVKSLLCQNVVLQNQSYMVCTLKKIKLKK